MNRKSFLLVAFFIILFVLSACDVPESTPTPIRITATQEVGIVISHTSTATATQPVNPTATFTRTPVPTYTPRPTKIIPPTETPTPLPVFAPQDFSNHPLAGIGPPFVKSGEAITEQNLGRLTELARWGKGVITDIAFSPDGKWLGVSASTGFYLYDVSTREEEFVLNYQEYVASFAISQKGDRIAIGFWGGIVQIVDLNSHKNLQVFHKENGIGEITFLDGDRYLLFTSDYSMAEVWDLETNSPVNLTEFMGGEPNFVIASTDGKTFAAIFGNEMRFWDWETGELSQEVYTTEWYFDGISKENTYFVLGMAGYVEVHRLDTGELVWDASAYCDECVSAIYPEIIDRDKHSPNCRYGSYDPQPPGLGNLKFSPDGSQVITFFQGQIQMRDSATGNILREFQSRTELALSPTGEWMAWGSQDGMIHIEQISDNSEIDTIVGFNQGIENLEFEPGGNRLVVQYWDAFRIRSLNDGGLFRTFEVNDLDISPDGNLLALGYPDGTVEIKQYNDLSLVQTLNDDPYPVNQVEFSPSGKTLLTVRDCAIYATDTRTWTNLYTVSQEYGPGVISITPDDKSFLYKLFEGFDSTTYLYQLIDGQLFNTLDVWGELETMTYSPEAEALNESGWVAAIDISGDWDLVKGGAFSPDGNLLVVVGGNGIGIKRVVDGELLFDSDDASASLIAFSPDGRYIALGSSDGVISLWGIAP